MHCPTCGQQQVSDQTRFCSRCGFPLTGVAEVVANNGLIPVARTGAAGTADSPRRRGIKQGVFLFLMTFLIVPLLALVTLALNIEPFLPVIGVLLFGMGGVLRVVYALMFEAGSGPAGLPQLSANTMPVMDNRAALPQGYAAPATNFTPTAGSWRDTNDLQHQPGSVTDSTTKLLQNEEDR